MGSVRPVGGEFVIPAKRGHGVYLSLAQGPPVGPKIYVTHESPTCAARLEPASVGKKENLFLVGLPKRGVPFSFAQRACIGTYPKIHRPTRDGKATAGFPGTFSVR